MYLICDYKGVIAEVCQHPAWVRKQSNGCVVLCDERDADAIYSNDTDSFYPAAKAAASGNPYHLEAVEDVPEGVAPIAWKYENGQFALSGEQQLGPELKLNRTENLVNILLGEE